MSVSHLGQTREVATAAADNKEGSRVPSALDLSLPEPAQPSVIFSLTETYFGRRM